MTTKSPSTSDEPFESFAAALDYPMFVVTTSARGQKAGCLVGFATQASISPSRFLVGLSDKNFTYSVAQHAEVLVVHVLGADQKELAELFGTETGFETDKFTRCAWHSGPAGVPVLDDAAAWFAARILDRQRLGDHVGFLVEPYAGDGTARDLELLSFSDVKDLEAGNEA